jgi:hypothetical protein
MICASRWCLLLLSFSSVLLSTNASPLVISDARIRNPDVTPALGRGYSMTTNQVLSTCLQFTDRTVPTYNYDYSFVEYSHDGHQTSEVEAGMSGSASWGWISASVTGSVKTSSEKNTRSRHVVAHMSTERYYASIDDTTATLTPDAQALIERGDLVGFFQACGSGYIRSIRRTAEFTGIFSFESTSEEKVKEAAASLQVKSAGGLGPSAELSVKSTSTSKKDDVTTRITIKAFGIGINDEGATTLVATDRASYDAAAQYAFKSMQTEDVGMIRGVEILPWSSNLQFQNAIRFEDQEVIAFNETTGERDLHYKWMDCTAGCKKAPAAVEGGELGACTAPGPEDQCADSQSADAATDYDGPRPAWYKQLPRPAIVHAIEVKAITMINAEFITTLEKVFTNQMHMTTTLQACATTLQQLTKAQKGKFKKMMLRDHSRMHMNPVAAGTESTMVEDAAKALNMAALKKRRESMQNFVKYFYGPCATQITRHSNAGRMTQYWWDFEECTPSLEETVDQGSNDIENATPGTRTDCLNDGVVYKTHADDNNKVYCEKDGALADVQGESDTEFGLDVFVLKFCMPEIDEHAHAQS